MNEEFEEDNFDDIDFDDVNDTEEVIEVDDEEIVIELKDTAIESNDDLTISKHTLEGKHSLKYDTIFKGKKEEPITEDSLDGMSMYFNDTFEVDKSSNYWSESIDNENYVKNKRVKEKVYEVLSEHTSISFTSNRRKPSKSDFNTYFYLLKTHLREECFTNIELLVELSYYFSDNLFNMFKLLDQKWKSIVIRELQDHIGKQTYSKEVMNRNIYLDTELEFEHIDENGNLRHITGVVIETDYDRSEYSVDSYEKIYLVKLEDIVKILNNDKFKNNLNKLNNIDFL